MVEHDPEADPGGEWVTISEAARRFGISPRAVRGRIRRGTVEWKPAGNAGRLVLAKPGDVSRDDPGTDDREELDQLDQLDQLREELMEARIAQARAEEHVTTATTEARIRAARAEARVEALTDLVAELRVMLAEARRPWWRRMIG